ncbi:pyridoxamine 5'-phosphate oxidase family protein [Nocardia jiangsuensis]|uniref:Pyridoxamine 5'-phosphate oxidase family protein n=1 Tax=Nocardia jiangsuensis TaxID=1691563 RepID=A0ABV8DPD1_9NOCA
MANTKHLDVLDSAQCLELLRTVRVGRLVFLEDSAPTVHPVNFRLHEDRVIIRVADGTKLRAALANEVVAFQADELDPDLRSGWSVTVVGHARLIRDIDELVAVAGTFVQPWAEGQRNHFIRVRGDRITGRRLLDTAPARPGG